MKILAVDGDSVFRRNWEATKGLDPVGAINRSTGLVSRTADADMRVIVAWDGGVDVQNKVRHPSFRKAKEPTYKADRKAPGPGYYTARAKCQGAMTGACVIGPEVTIDGFTGYAEADDVLAWVAKEYAAVAGANALLRIMSTDGDVESLARDIPRIEILKFGGKPEDAVWNAKRIESRRGVEPHEIPEMKALMGDKSEFPGFDGIGETTAAMLIRRFGTAAIAVAQAPDLDPGNEAQGIPLSALNKNQRASLRAGGVELAARGLWLATLRPDLPLPPQLLTGMSSPSRIGGDDPNCVCRQPGAEPGPCGWCDSRSLPDIASIRAKVSPDTWLGKTCLDLCDAIERLTGGKGPCGCGGKGLGLNGFHYRGAPGCVAQ